MYCKQCEPGFILQADSLGCLTGSVSNCQSYDLQQKCVKCINGFYLKSEIECAVNDQFGKIVNCKGTGLGFGWRMVDILGDYLCMWMMLVQRFRG